MVRQLINNNGNAAANQFVIETESATYFQSYTSVVAKIMSNGNVVLSSNWDYSRTTSKHLYIFLAQYGYRNLCSAAAVRKAITNGEVTLEKVPSLNII